MEAVAVIAVVGSCGPERRRYAKWLAASERRVCFPAAQLLHAPHPAREAVAVAEQADTGSGVVLEIPDEVAIPDLIAACAEAHDRIRLRNLICVVDASHLLEDLHRDDYLTLCDANSAGGISLVGRALLAALQIEFASTLVVVNWERLATPDLSVVLAVLNHLSPRARLRLQQDTPQPDLLQPDVPHALPAPGVEYLAEQDRAGWVCLLNDNFDPYMADSRVRAFRYEQIRPIHPERLMHLLERLAAGEFGWLLRSAGFCRLATRPGVVGQWDQAGRVISLMPLALDDRVNEQQELLALGQDLAGFGLDLDVAALTAALDAVVLTDAELAAGPAVWAAYHDPFPVWVTASEGSE